MNIGYIYKIYNDNNTYYGSTKNNIKKRLSNHLYKWKLYKEGNYHFITCFDIFEEGNFKIELVEELEYLSKYDLLNKEAEYIRNNNCINKCIPLRSKHQYYIDNKQSIREKRILRHNLTGKW